MMRVNSLFLLTMLFVTTIVGCTKQGVIPAEELTEISKNEFQACSCKDDIKNGAINVQEYIKAEINDVSMCFDLRPGLGDTFPNMFKHGYLLKAPAQYYDNLYMIRNTQDNKWQAALFLENTNALTKSYPYTLPRPNPEFCEIGELQINDLHNYISCFDCPENKFNYLAPLAVNGVKMTVSSFDNNIFEGSFEGNAWTGSGKKITIKNGKFKIKLAAYRLDF